MLLIIDFFKKNAALDVWQGSENASLDISNIFKIIVKPKTNWKHLVFVNN